MKVENKQYQPLYAEFLRVRGLKLGDECPHGCEYLAWVTSLPKDEWKSIVDKAAAEEGGLIKP